MPDRRLNEVEPNAVQTLRDLVQQLEDLETDFRKDAKSQQRFRRWVAFIGAVVVLGISGILYTAVSIKGLIDYVASCNTPNGVCAQQGAKRTGAAIGQINENVFNSSIYLGECARQYPDLRGAEYSKVLRACVAAKRKAEGQMPMPR